MSSHAVLNIAAGILTLWGVAHLVPTRAVVRGFGPISTDNRRIITMEWVLEGVTLCFLGLLALMLSIRLGPQNTAARFVLQAEAAMLVVMAIISSLTGARTAVIPMKICPVVKLTAAAVFIAATL
jgi:hypothetical protein